MSHRTARFLAALFGSAGALHTVRPQVFDPLVPRSLPGPARLYTYASGAAELAVAGLLAVPRTRRTGGVAAAALLVAVFPGNLVMARAWRRKPAWMRAIAYGRLPLQGVLIGQAVHVARGQPTPR